MTDVGAAVWLSCGYSLVLVGIGYLIDLMARRAAKRAFAGKSVKNRPSRQELGGRGAMQPSAQFGRLVAS